LPQQNGGATMRKIGLSTALAVVFALAGSQAASAQNCQLKLVNTVPIKMMAGGARPIVPLILNGVEKPFLLDTGGAATQINQATVQELKLPTREMQGKMMDLYGDVSNYSARIDTLTLGHAQDRNTELPILTSTLGGAQLFVGLLAADYMASYDVELDFGGGKMNFFSKDHCEGKVIYWNNSGAAVVPMLFRDHHINIPVLLNGKPFKAIMDTGAPGTTLLAPEAKRVFDITRESPGITISSSGPEPRPFEYIFDSLNLEGINVGKPRITIIPDLMGKNDPNNHLVTGTRLQRVNDRDSNQATMLIGMNILSKLRIYIAFSENKLYITPATTPVSASD
jgi:predicted aspartyl protease